MEETKDVKRIEVCCGATCTSRGSDALYEVLEKEFEGTGVVEVTLCSCLGHCQKGPNVLIDENEIFHYSNPASIVHKISSHQGKPFKRFTEEELFASEDFLGDL